MISLADAFNQALKHHQAGEMTQAEQGYRQVLELDPRHVNALHLLGVLAHQTSLRLRENFAEAHFNLGVVTASRVEFVDRLPRLVYLKL